MSLHAAILEIAYLLDAVGSDPEDLLVKQTTDGLLAWFSPEELHAAEIELRNFSEDELENCVARIVGPITLSFDHSELLKSVLVTIHATLAPLSFG